MENWSLEETHRITQELLTRLGTDYQVSTCLHCGENYIEATETEHPNCCDKVECMAKEFDLAPETETLLY